MKTNKIIKTIFCLALFASSIIANAQDDLGGGNGNGDVLDNPAAPIDSYLYVLAIFGIFMAYKLIKKSKSQIKE